MTVKTVETWLDVLEQAHSEVSWAILRRAIEYLAGDRVNHSLGVVGQSDVFSTFGEPTTFDLVECIAEQKAPFKTALKRMCKACGFDMPKPYELEKWVNQVIESAGIELGELLLEIVVED